MKYSKADIDQAVDLCVKQTLSIMEQRPEFKIVTNENLIEWAELQAPTDADPISEYKQWTLTLCSVREGWRDAILLNTGRFPKTIHGYGFEILQPGENITYTTHNVSKQILSAIRKGAKILNNTRDSDLTRAERTAKMNHQVRLSSLHQHASQARRDAIKTQTPPIDFTTHGAPKATPHQDES